MLSFIYTFLTTPKGSIICLASICVLLTLFLRFLFGPKGTFRKPEWNTESDSLDALPQWFLRNKEEFLRYSSTYINKKADTHYHLQLKVDHTLRVVKNAFLLSKVEPVFQDKELTRALLLSALYHDIGRFEQFTRYKTFSDASSCNHGLLSCKILKKKNLLKNETKAVRHLVYTAVGLHNRFAIPKNMPKRHAYVLLGVRDADKLDILRIMEGHLAKNNIPDDTVIMHLQEIPGAYSSRILEALREKKTASFRDMHSANDFRLLLCTWIFELFFPESRRLLKKAGSLDSIIDGMQGIHSVQAEAQQITFAALQNTPV